MIDTASKRYAISNVTQPWRMVSTVPDGTTSAANRIADGYLYAFGVTVITAGWICVQSANLEVSSGDGSLDVSEATGTLAGC